MVSRLLDSELQKYTLVPSANFFVPQKKIASIIITV